MTCTGNVHCVETDTPSKRLQLYTVILAQVFTMHLCARLRRHSHVPRDIEQAISDAVEANEIYLSGSYACGTSDNGLRARYPYAYAANSVFLGISRVS